MYDGFTILSGTANPQLAADVAAGLGVEVAPCDVHRFPDGEVSVELLRSVRRTEVLLVQPTAPPGDRSLVELLVLADACRRAAAARITAVVPYFAFARQDRRTGRREPITARLVATLMQAAGIDHVVTVDLHTPQLEGFFRIPVDALSAVEPLCEAVRGHVDGDVVVVSPDAGRVALATEYARRLGAPLAVLHKRRESGTETEVTHLVGEVDGRACLVIDDMVSTGGTLVKSVRALREAGARSCAVAATHGLFVGDALRRLRDDDIHDVWVTDTVPVPASPADDAPVPRVVSVAPLIAAALRRMMDGADG